MSNCYEAILSMSAPAEQTRLRPRADRRPQNGRFSRLRANYHEYCVECAAITEAER